MTIKQLRDADYLRKSIYVDFVRPIGPCKGGRLIGVGRKYVRIMSGSTVINNVRPEQIESLRG